MHHIDLGGSHASKVGTWKLEVSEAGVGQAGAEYKENASSLKHITPTWHLFIKI